MSDEKKIHLLKKENPAPDNLAAELRELADDVVEAGRLTCAIVGFIRDDCYEILWGASLVDSMVLANLMADSAVQRFKIG